MKILINAMNLIPRNGCGLYSRQLTSGLLEEGREVELHLAMPPKKPWSCKHSMDDLDKFNGIGPSGLPLRSGAPTAHLSPRKQNVSYGLRFREHCQAAKIVTPGGLGAGLFPSSFWHYRTLPTWERNREYDIFHDPNQIGCFFHDSPSAKILTVHDLSPMIHPRMHPRERVRKHRTILPIIMKNTELVVVPSNATGNDVHELLSVERDRIRTIYPGCDHLKEAVPEEFSKVKKRMEILSERPFIILSVSVLEPRKNVDLLIDAFDLFCTKVKDPEDMFLVIVGECGWKYGRILKRISSSRFRNNIIRAGGVSEGVLVSLYRNSDVFVYISQKEGFGFPPLEAQYFGLPAIISSDNALREVSGGGTVVIGLDNERQRTAQNLCECLMEMRASPDYRKEFSVKGKRNARKYTTKKFANNMRRAYRDVLS